MRTAKNVILAAKNKKFFKNTSALVYYVSNLVNYHEKPKISLAYRNICLSFG